MKKKRFFKNKFWRKTRKFGGWKITCVWQQECKIMIETEMLFSLLGVENVVVYLEVGDSKYDDDNLE
jgi:hypothetical protein